MKKNDFLLISYIGIVLGAVFFDGGLAVYFYNEAYRDLDGTHLTFPYQRYSGSLLIAGAILLVVGLAFQWTKQEDEEPRRRKRA